jgi:divalent metal cation (Fe/Co/Zn/Cd) transporter
MRRRSLTARQCLLLVRIAWWNCYPPRSCWCNFPGALLFVLAAIVASTALLSLVLHLRPETSHLGMLVTIAALIAMPILATLKRREARRTNNVALAADAVQSATCAYLALVTLTGLTVNAAFHVPWVDSLAALVAVPILLHEGWLAWQGHACGCC